MAVADPVTWQIIDPVTRQPTAGAENSPEKVAERQIAALRAGNPQEFLRRYPRSEVEKKAFDDAFRSVSSPKTLPEVLDAEPDPQKRDAILKSLDRMLNPQKYQNPNELKDPSIIGRPQP